jgi:hypothetical protein
VISLLTKFFFWRRKIMKMTKMSFLALPALLLAASKIVAFNPAGTNNHGKIAASAGLVPTSEGAAAAVPIADNGDNASGTLTVKSGNVTIYGARTGDSETDATISKSTTLESN